MKIENLTPELARELAQQFLNSADEKERNICVGLMSFSLAARHAKSAEWVSGQGDSWHEFFLSSANMANRNYHDFEVRKPLIAEWLETIEGE